MNTLLDTEWLPGLVYQCQLQPDGRRTFTCLSGNCHALLGVSADELRADPVLFENLILEEDRALYQAAMAACTSEMCSCNWVGRIWIDAWKDTKWINLRCMPHRLADGIVQLDGIITNITQSKLLEAEIKHSRARLAELSEHLLAIKEQERTRIAREIHDDLGSNLTAIKMALALLAKHLPAGQPALREETAYVDSLVDRSIEAVHRIASDLRPGMLDFGLAAAIAWQAQEFEKQTGIPCRFLANRDEIALDTDAATALFRILQEALSNVGKHAAASQVAVRLLTGEHSLRLEISDNGCGIAVAAQSKPKSFGIRAMIERVNALGGELTIGAMPKGGTCVKIRIPLLRHARSAPDHGNDDAPGAPERSGTGA